MKKGWETIHRCENLVVAQNGDTVVLNIIGWETVILEVGPTGKLAVQYATCTSE